MDKRIDRRRFLQGAAVGLGGLASAAIGAGKASGAAGIPAHPRHHRVPVDAVDLTILPSGVTVPTARWLVEENARPGSVGWIVTGLQIPHAIEGFASHVSAASGDEITLYINTVANTVSMQAYRMGYYQGLGGRLIYQSDTVAAQRQPPPVFTPGVNTIECPWAPSMTVKIDRTWPPGCYLLKIIGDGGQQQYIPLTVRDDASRATYVMQNSVATWQAYNLWGNYSLYYGLAGGGRLEFANRGRIVSFDKPYPKEWAHGSADFLGNEFPLLFDMERLGLDMTYWTDVDLHQRPELLAAHRCLFTMGHDEYWSTPMRQGATAALANGTNLVFLGANACYRQIRLESSPVGPNRHMVCYKDAAEDPILSVQPELTTVNWPQAPLNDPENTLIGSMYQSVGANGDLVIADSSAWFFDGCNLTDGQRLPGVVQGEFDRYVPSMPGPTNVDVFAHSPVNTSNNWSDITYFTPPGGGGVLALGMASLVNMLSNTTAFPTIIVPGARPGVTDILLRAMQNVYGAFGSGPASAVSPSSGTWTSVYRGLSARVGTVSGTNAA